MERFQTPLKVLLCALALVLASTLTACGGADQPPTSDQPNRPVSEQGEPSRIENESGRNEQSPKAGVATKGDYLSVSAGDDHTCAIKADNNVVCWGSNLDALGKETGQATPPEGELFAFISAGFAHTCGIRADGTETCWGNNTFGQAAWPGDLFESLAAGATHTCGLRSDGTVTCWGTESRSHSLNPPEGELFTSISAGYGHTCGIRTNDTIYCWGDLPYQGLIQEEYSAVSTEEQYSTVSVGDKHFCGVRKNGSVDCYGHVFDTDITPPAGTFMSVSSGRLHTCGVRENGSVTCWGGNVGLTGEVAGQIDPPSSQFLSIAAGGYHNCGVKKEGSISCWGDDYFGQASPP